MAHSGNEKEFVSYVVDLMQSIGPVYARAMFGGHGIFLDGLMFALIIDNVLYLKASKDHESKFKDRGLDAFTYTRNNRIIQMSYYQAPEETLEDIEEMTAWASNAYSEALKAGSKKY